MQKKYKNVSSCLQGHPSIAEINKIAYMYTSTTQIRVRYAETDQMGVVYYGNYAQYFEVGRVEAMRQLGFSYKKMEEQGVMLPVTELKIKYLRAAKYDDLLNISTTIRELPEDHKIVFHVEVFNAHNKLLTTGAVTLYFLDTSNWHKVKMPPEMKAALLPYFKKKI